MPIRCAWCGTRLGDDPQLAGESHGICDACQAVNFPVRADPDGRAPESPEHSGHDGKR